jgi:hypothetical protein
MPREVPMTDSVWRILFAVAAVFNFVAGLPLLLVPAEAVALLGIAPQTTLFFAQMSGALIATFGVGYAMVARNLAMREFVLLGAIGKLLAVVLVTIYWQGSELSDLTFALGLGDLASRRGIRKRRHVLWRLLSSGRRGNQREATTFKWPALLASRFSSNASSLEE